MQAETNATVSAGKLQNQATTTHAYGWSPSSAWQATSPTQAITTPEAILVVMGCEAIHRMYH